MDIIDYSSCYQDQVAALMAELQDFEAALDSSRPPGTRIAKRHFEFLLDCCARQQGSVYLAVDAGEVLGFAVVLIEHEDDGDLHLHAPYKTYGQVTDLVVKEGHRGRGVAARLMAKAESHVQALGITTVRVTALATNGPARDFYAKAGYRPFEVTLLKEL